MLTHLDDPNLWLSLQAWAVGLSVGEHPSVGGERMGGGRNQPEKALRTDLGWPRVVRPLLELGAFHYAWCREP